MIGTTRDVELDVSLTHDATLLARPSPGIEPLDDELTAFRGEIVEPDTGEESRVRLDVGLGTVVTSAVDVEESCDLDSPERGPPNSPGPIRSTAWDRAPHRSIR